MPYYIKVGSQSPPFYWSDSWSSTVITVKASLAAVSLHPAFPTLSKALLLLTSIVVIWRIVAAAILAIKAALATIALHPVFTAFPPCLLLFAGVLFGIRRNIGT